jgi:hypothetical protein
MKNATQLETHLRVKNAIFQHNVEEISTILHRTDNTMQHIQDKDEPSTRMKCIL